MPKYYDSGTNNYTLNPVAPTVIYPGDDKYLFGTAPNTPGVQQAANDSNVEFEAVGVGERSIAVQLARGSQGSAPGAIVEVIADADPGAAEIDIQDSAVDADGAYITPANGANTINAFTNNGAYWIAIAELQPSPGGFTTLKMVANPNAVNWRAKIRYV
jgi:hypothetical protein